MVQDTVNTVHNARSTQALSTVQPNKPFLQIGLGENNMQKMQAATWYER